jgi:hypothetical protein
MFRHMVAILTGSWVPDKLLEQCSVLWACADYDPSCVASCRAVCPHSTTGYTGWVIIRNHMPKHVGVKIWNVLIKIHYFLEHLLVFLQTEGYSFPKSTHTCNSGKNHIWVKWWGDMSQHTIQEGSDFVHRVMAGLISGNVRCIVDMKIRHYHSEPISWHYWSWK